MSIRKHCPLHTLPGTSTPAALIMPVAVCLMAACIGAGSAQPQPEPTGTPAGQGTVQRQQDDPPPREEDETDPESPDYREERPEDESVYEGIPAPDEPEEDEADEELDRPGDSYLWGGRDTERADPTITAEGALTMFMRARNYRTIRILKSVMTSSLQASFERDSARFNGKQNVQLSAFHFQPDDLKAVHYTGPQGARQADIYDATVRSLWIDQGELADRRLEVVRLAQEESGLWRVGRLDIRESDKSRYQELIPSVTSLRKVLRAWHRRQPALAEPLLTESFVRKYAAEGESGEAGIGHLFEGDPSLRHAAFEIQEIRWKEDSDAATAHVDLYVTARNRFGSLDPHPLRLDLVRIGAGWYVDSWEKRD
jgi:hypothetical protein